jgi:DNA-binding MarR family transcriptional regulator
MSNLKRDYLDSVSLVERLHRQFLEVVKLELDRMNVRDINNVQALILYNIGKDELTVGELTQRGYYLGSNVSYNLKKLIDNDYISQARSPHDRRSVRVKLTTQGLKLHDRLDQVFARHADELTRALVKPQELAQLEQTLRRMEQFWVGAIGQGGYAPLVTSAAE